MISYSHDQFHHRIVSIHDKDVCIGEFRIYGTFDTGTPCDMTISINEEYRGKGLSRVLIKRMVEEIKKEKVRPDQLLCIDVDASNGFWDYIGMKPNRYGLDYKGKRNVECRGYEKVILVSELERFCNKF
jgi:hypothetical protein